MTPGWGYSPCGRISFRVSPVTVRCRISPSSILVVSSFENLDHPSAFSNSWRSLSSSFHLLVRICFFVMSSKSCFLRVRRVSTALLHGEDRSRTTVCMVSLESISSSRRSMIVKLASAAIERSFLCKGLSRAFWRVTI